MIKIYDMRTQSLINPIGIDERPIFSYKLDSTENNVLQTSYHIEVSKKADFTNPVWDSEVSSGKSIAITYDGEALEPMTRYYWRVSVETDNAGVAISDTAYFETGLMGNDQSVWSGAKWISNPGDTINTDGLLEYVIDADFSLDGNRAGFVIGARDKDNYTLIELGADKVNVYEYSDNAWDDGISTVVHMASADACIKESKHIRIEMRKGIGTVILNDVTVIDNKRLINPEKVHHPRQLTLMNFGFKSVGRLEVKNLVISDLDGSSLLNEAFNKDSYLSMLGRVENNTLIVENEFNITTASPTLNFRKVFEAKGEITNARLYSSSRGFYDAYINGEKVNASFYNPGFTDYRKRIYYQTFDVTDKIKKGTNIIGATVAKGYYTGYLGYNAFPMIYGKKNSFIAKLVITYENGETEIITTDESWSYTNKGHVINSDYLQGEYWDMRSAFDWNNLSDTRWGKCSVEAWSETVVPTNGICDDLKFELVSQVGPMAEIEREVSAKYIGENPKGHQIYDLGQNIVGSARIKVKGEEGQTIKIRYGEMCYRDGRIYLANLRNAANTDMFTLAGNDEGETFFPTFTSHGYRYIEITGCEEEQIVEVKGITITNTTEVTGGFECSNPFINQLQSNIQWGQRDNSLLVFTDCPQRNERMGWTGDAQVFAATAAYNMNVKAFMNKWLIDVRDAQIMYNRKGAVPDTAPLGGDNRPMGGCAGWGDAAVIVPWEMYKAYGDINILRDNYKMMCDWVEYQSLPERQNCGERTVDGEKAVSDLSSEPYIQVQQSRGDHLTFDESTPFILSATAYAAYVTKLLSQIADILGHENDAKKYYSRYETVKRAFNEAWVQEDGSIAYWGEQSKDGINKTYYSENGKNRPSQTAYALAIDFGLIDEEKLENTKRYFKRSIEERDNCLSVGFLGISHLAPALEKVGLTDMAFTLLEQEKFPSWLYSVKNGATTIWERWNSYIAETDTFGDIAMNSFNHYSYGAIGEWMFSSIAGIYPGEAGYKKIILKPTVGGNLTYARAYHNSPYGMICSGWEKDADKVRYKFRIPPNTTAVIRVDGMEETEVGSGEYEFVL